MLKLNALKWRSHRLCAYQNIPNFFPFAKILRHYGENVVKMQFHHEISVKNCYNKTTVNPKEQTMTKQSTNNKTITFGNIAMYAGKQLINPQNYHPNNIKTQMIRGVNFGKAVVALAKVSQKAYEINQKPDITNAEITVEIQKFCQAFCQSVNLDVVCVNPMPQQHALWTSNHISWLDIPVIGSVVPTFFLSKAEISQWPLIGWLARTGNTLFIKRGSGDTNAVSHQIAKFLQDGSPVVFFPEATTTDGTAIKKIHGKLLQSAMDTAIHIQPIVICYVNDKGELDNKIPYFGEMNFFQSVKNVLDNRKATAYVLPLESINPAGKSRDELTEILQQRMEDGLKQLHQQVLTAV